MLAPGRYIPDATVAQFKDPEIKKFKMHKLMDQGRYLLVGVPGVFTPVCTHNHIPSILAKSEDIIRMGIKRIYCITGDNPWAVDVWRKGFDSGEKINFLSDGNHEFLQKSGMQNDESDLFLAGTYKRFIAIIQDKVLLHLSTEKTVLEIGDTDGKKVASYLKDIERLDMAGILGSPDQEQCITGERRDS